VGDAAFVELGCTALFDNKIHADAMRTVQQFLAEVITCLDNEM
jgi:hypothetical protein